LVWCFPMPSKEDGIITPMSVTRAASSPSSQQGSSALASSFPPLLLGNAARCLIPYAECQITAEILFLDGYKSKTSKRSSSSGTKLYTVERLICAMANCTDTKVRKNVAIVLSRACKYNEDVKERVTYYRGVQMMTELQSTFI